MITTPNGGSIGYSVGVAWTIGFELVGRAHMVFVSVNQVLVRLWARRRSRCLTGKCCSSEQWLPRDHYGNYVQRRCIELALRDGGERCVCVLSKLACCVWRRNAEDFIGVDGSCAWWALRK
jgi:hypothetical protein